MAQCLQKNEDAETVGKPQNEDANLSSLACFGAILDGVASSAPLVRLLTAARTGKTFDMITACVHPVRFTLFDGMMSRNTGNTALGAGLLMPFVVLERALR